VQLAGEVATLLATAAPSDPEMEDRIRRHRDARPPGWTTIEEQLAVRAALESRPPQEAVVVDCLTLWVSNLIAEGWDDAAIEEEGRKLAAAAACRHGLTIAVSNEVGLGIVPATAVGRRFRDVLGRINTAFAAVADRAQLVVAGRTLDLA
jgi:adenosyl cobinamide kinase/adenosyl cobinamide phosphate guanylyltransferase